MIDEQDLRFLRHSFEVARRSRANGNYPFASILVSDSGEILLEAENTVNSKMDCTGHAEVNLVRAASQQFSPEILSRSAVYASAEPCAMCSGALHWSGIGRLVYGLSKVRASEIEREKNAGPQLLIDCRTVLGAGERFIEVDGPALEDEAATLLTEG